MGAQWAVRSFRRQGHTAPAGGEPVLSVRDVHARYGTAEALHGVGPDIAAGRALAIVGESGSGRSSIARVITGLLPPRRGQPRRRWRAAGAAGARDG